MKKYVHGELMMFPADFPFNGRTRYVHADLAEEMLEVLKNTLTYLNSVTLCYDEDIVRYAQELAQKRADAVAEIQFIIAKAEEV
jgi:recombinational DNA repair ATPase RecF